MIDVAIFIAFAVVAVRIMTAISREYSIFIEFRQPTILRFAALLYPLGPLILFIATLRIGFLSAAVLAGACYVPGLILARRLSKGLERAGTDRVKGARDIASTAFVAALGGLIYVTVYLLLTMGIAFI